MMNCTSCAMMASQMDDTCDTNAFQKIDVCVPVSVTPFAHAGETKTKCCGDPIVTAGDTTCPGRRNGSCTFTIRQKICVKVPVRFGANAVVGDTFVSCLEVSDEDICRNCEKED